MPIEGDMDRYNNDPVKDRAWTQIEQNRARFRSSLGREGRQYYGLLIISVLGAAAPGAILLITADPADWLRYLRAGLAAIGVLAALVDAKIGTRQRYKAVRSTRSKVEQLANKYAGDNMSREEAMQELNLIQEEYEKARVETMV